MYRPAAAHQRIAVLDVLRGFAVAGIFVVNFSLDVPWNWRQADSLTPQLDSWAGPAVQFWFSDKFRAIFALLFGVGFALQSARAAESGFTFFYLRRMGWLFLIGVCNRLIRGSDILHGYAMLGVILLGLRRCSDRTLIGLAAVLTLLPWQLIKLWFPSRYSRPSLQADSGLVESVVIHARDFLARAWVADPWIYWIGEVLPIFLLGYWIGRKARFELPDSSRLIAGMTGFALLMGFSLNVVALQGAGADGAAGWFFGLCRDGGTLALAAAYIGVIVVVFSYRPQSVPMTALASTGRMALTNYLSQSLIFVLVFYPIGLGWYGRLGVTPAIAIALICFPLQVVLSRWWLRRYRYGPLEWIWRSLSYRRAV